jgi:protein ImuB
MNWLAIHLPSLPLEVYTRALEVQVPLAVSQRNKGEWILLCNPAAGERGVRPGQSPGGALALVADLRILPRKPEAEQAALERLAAWCSRFSSQVSLHPPQAVVFEAARSLRLFGGAEAFLNQVTAEVSALGYETRCCLAPTAGGALVLAAWGVAGLICDADALRSALSQLPLGALDVGERTHADLGRMGLRQVGELLRLPRSGLAERLGWEQVQHVDRLLGKAPDLRRRFEPPPHYRGRLDLPAELEQVDALLFPCRRLLSELAGVLIGCQGGVQHLTWRLLHDENAEETRFTLGAARPEQDPGRWLELLWERLGRLRLPAPVRAIALHATEIRPFVPRSSELFTTLGRTHAHAPDQDFLDRLRARLGAGAVRGLALVLDHRPERAWRWCAVGGTGKGSGRADRPVWLLAEPLPLEAHHCHPQRNGKLELGPERERIETGWWDGFEVARDYFVATTARGERLWLYRELGGRRGWFLHGRF